MSVVGRSVGDTRPTESYQPVALVSATTGAPVTQPTANSDGSLDIAGVNGTASSSATNPVATRNYGASNNFRILSAAATTNASVVKGSAGGVSQITGYNANAAARYLKIYNKATAPTVGTDTPVWTEYLAPQSKFSVSMSGFYFATGIGLALTTAGADADTGALTAGDILALNVSYF